MPKRSFIRRMVNLEVRDYKAIWEFAREKGLGGKGFSAALRMIVREWQFYRQQSGVEQLSAPAEFSPKPSADLLQNEP